MSTAGEASRRVADVLGAQRAEEAAADLRMPGTAVAEADQRDPLGPAARSAKRLQRLRAFLQVGESLRSPPG